MEPQKNLSGLRQFAHVVWEAGGILRIPDEKLTSVLLSFNDLPDLEEKIIRLRYGIDDGCPKTLEEVSEIFQLTRERVRQIEAKAIRKMRHPVRVERLKGLIGE